MLTYRTIEAANRDKSDLCRLLDALNAAPFQLRRDACGTWIGCGSRGYAATWGDGKTWMLVVTPEIEVTKWQWTADKKRLAFAEVTQDGDYEGVFRLHRLPTPEEAEVQLAR
jgi:hypothetical protein